MPYKIQKPNNAAGAAWPAIAVGLFVAFGGVLFGYDTGTIGGILAMPYWLKTFSTGYTIDGAPAITASQKSEIVSILSAGTFFGALTAGPTCDYIGRKPGLMASTVVFTVGVILQTAAVAIPTFVAGRFFAGFGVGMISASIPLYQSETSPKWIRGAIVGCYQLAITIGLLIAAIVDNATKDRNNTGSYRVPIAVQFAWALIIFFGMLVLPETPRMYVKRGQPEKAARSLSRLRRLEPTHPAIVEELAEITANHEYETSLGKASYIDCFKGNLGKRLATGCLLQSLQQLTGVNFIFYFGTSFFAQTGLFKAFTLTLITSCINTASTFPGLYWVETMGRRNLLLMGAFGMTVCQFIVGAVGTALPPPDHGKASANAIIAFICIYIFFFASSWGPVAWVVTGEIFPLKTRSKSLSMTTASNWLLNWAIAYATPYLVSPGPNSANLGFKVFFIWGGCCFICIAFVYLLIYETKGLSLEQVDEMYAKIDKAWESKNFTPTLSWAEVEELGAGGRHQSLADIESEVIRKKSVAVANDEKHVV